MVLEFTKPLVHVGLSFETPRHSIHRNVAGSVVAVISKHHVSVGPGEKGVLIAFANRDNDG